MINRKSIQSHHELARLMPISFAAGVEAENNHRRIERERAIAARARDKAYWQSFKNREGETHATN